MQRRKGLRLGIIFLSIIAIILTLFIIVKIFEVDRNKEALNLIARLYFDEQYYLETYPEVKQANMDAFEHYTNQGWKENKNPRQDFDTSFYKLVNYGYNKYGLNPLQHYIRSGLSFKSSYLHPSQAKTAKPLENPEYYLALVAVFRDEAPYLKEWIEFYKLVGVEKFYLYNHLSVDNYREVLDPYIQEGLVELQQITVEPKNLAEWNLLQTSTYTRAAKELEDSVEWLIVADTDEFLFPVETDDLREVLKNYDDYASVSVNWQIFGSGEVEKIGEDQLLIESLLFSDKFKDYQVKSIVKPRYVQSITNPHFPILKPGYFQVTEDYTLFKGPFSHKIGKKILRINHYWARDWDFFRKTKLGRVHILAIDLTELEKQKKIEQLIEVNRRYSSKYDDSILSFATKLKDRMRISDS